MMAVKMYTKQMESTVNGNSYRNKTTKYNEAKAIEKWVVQETNRAGKNSVITQISKLLYSGSSPKSQLFCIKLRKKF